MAKEHEILTHTKRALAGLPERARDVIVRRFGLKKGLRETLEAVGQSYNITRERVRQIEAAGIKALKERFGQTNIRPYFELLKDHVAAYGGVMEQNHLVTSFQREKLGHGQTNPVLGGAVLLMLAVGEPFERRRGNDQYYPHWYLHVDHVKNMENSLAVIHRHFTGLAKVQKLPELVKVLAKEGIQLSPSIIEAYVEISRHLDQNPYGDFGFIHWPEVRPKGVRDKAYLVLKNHGKPRHFLEVTKLINEHGFAKKPALAQTVHNELIKDKRFVLVGRGIYGLREWGFEPGTVKDIIVKVLKAHKAPMSREAVVAEVLKHRFVKPNTIMLNLHNRKEFVRLKDGLYTLR